MGRLHSYGLEWIDEDSLYQVTLKVIGGALERKRRENKRFPPDMFTVVAQAVLTESSLSSSLEFDVLRSANKTLSNAIGNWHQSVLGLAPKWENLGTQGGLLDLRMKAGCKSEKWGRPIVVEVKNRFNTIKKVDEKNVWDNLDRAARLENAVAYLFQIIPETPERYDRPWKVSGRDERPNIRCCDGATAYDMVFEHNGALRELSEVFPMLVNDVANNSAVMPEGFEESELEIAFRRCLPD